MHEIRDWKADGPDRVLLRTQATGWQWRAITARRCPSLLHTQALGWKSRDRKVCGGRGDEIVMRADRCVLRSLERMTEAAEGGAAEGEKPGVGQDRSGR